MRCDELEMLKNSVCPNCRYRNFSMAEQCKCGYMLRGPQKDLLMHLVTIDRSLRTIKNVAIVWFWLTVLGMLGFFMLLVDRLHL